MQITSKTILAILSFALIFFFINEISYYNSELKNTKQTLYNKNKSAFNTIKNMQGQNIKSLSLLLANDNIIKEAYLYDDPTTIINHLKKFWKELSKDKLIYEIHFFKPPAKSFVNFSNFKSYEKDVSDTRIDMVHTTTKLKSSLHAIMCKTYAGLRATTPILDENGKILGGISMGKKIDWLPQTIKKILKNDSFLVYTKNSSKSLEKFYYENFIKNKTIMGEFILADKTIQIDKKTFLKIDFSKDIQNIIINNKEYSLNIFEIRDFQNKEFAYLCILNPLDEFYKNFTNRLLKNIILLFIASLFIYLLLKSKINFIKKQILELQDISKELKNNNFNILKDKNIKRNIIDKDEFHTLQSNIIDMGRSLQKSYTNLEKRVSQRTKELEYEKNYIQKILDLTPDITLVTNGKKLISANQRFYEFVEYEKLEDFLKEHECICDYFVSVNGEVFNNDTKIIQNEIWSIYIANQEQKNHTAILEKNQKLYYFNINAVYLNDIEVLVTLQDITELKKRDKLLYEQSKMASMGEMITNIAHQWRQPLSVISTGITGIKVQKEFGKLSDDEFLRVCDIVNKNIQYLSKTIDNFRSFIKGDKVLISFNLKNNIETFLSLVNATAKTHDINLILDLQDDIIISGYPNELTQCFINIFNNSQDILKQLDQKRLIFISTKKSNNKIIIEIKDNAGGIDNNIIDKIFDPYFTTKHKSQGTGLGLHMTYKLIVEGMNGSIEANNINLEYENKKYKGANFIITLNS